MRLAAIDVGSNAIRLVIGELDRHGDIKTLKKYREPIRLGKDVFKNGTVSTKSLERVIRTFEKFSDAIRSHKVEVSRAVATSAMREAKNRDELIKAVKFATDISIDVIDGIEEGRLIFSAVTHRVDLQEKVSLLIDIGGGSAELTIADHGKPISCQTFKMGTVRLLQLLEDRGFKEKQIRPIIQELIGPVKLFLNRTLKGLKIDHAIGTGGNFECLGKLRVALLQKNSIFSMTLRELDQLVLHLESMSIKERIQFLRLKPDRADVVVPAALVASAIMASGEVDVLTIPYVGLRDGILADLAERAFSTTIKR